MPRVLSGPNVYVLGRGRGGVVVLRGILYFVIPNLVSASQSYLCLLCMIALALISNLARRSSRLASPFTSRPISIVDERDHVSLQNAIYEVLRQSSAHGGNDGNGNHCGGSSGSLIPVRIKHGLVSLEASMSVVCGSDGLVVVTRVYNW